jgi:ubiquinone/menaquinone biosynthesis C-methylase UbiE
MKLNIGSGYKRYEDFLNVDDDPLVSPDYIVNLEESKLPFEDNSIEEIRAYHILEHIKNFIPLMQEFYRICKHGAVIDVVAPHHNHEVYYGDPTHVRPITVNGMYLFSKNHCSTHKEQHDSSSGLAFKYGVDFEVISYDFDYDTFYVPLITQFNQRKDKGEVSQEEDFAFQRLMREANNVAINTKIKLMVIKDEQ